jgi:mxaJ protein
MRAVSDFSRTEHGRDARATITHIAVAVALLVLVNPARAEAPSTQPAQQQRILRVVADPNNLPFSNDKEEGFENAIAHLLADALGAKCEFLWYAQRRGYVRETIKADLADVVIGVPHDLDMLLTTKPYYRSGYVFVSRADRHLDVRGFDDPVLKKLKIGVQLIGDDSTNTPPAHALGKRGIVTNVVGYSVYSHYRLPNPPARIRDAVTAGDVDVAVVWGPLAGYYAKFQATSPLELRPVTPQADGPLLMAFDISVGVKRRNTALRDEIDRVLVAKRAEIDAILDRFNIPRVPAPPPPPPPPPPPGAGGAEHASHANAPVKTEVDNR